MTENNGLTQYVAQYTVLESDFRAIQGRYSGFFGRFRSRAEEDKNALDTILGDLTALGRQPFVEQEILSNGGIIAGTLYAKIQETQRTIAEYKDRF